MVASIAGSGFGVVGREGVKVADTSGSAAGGHLNLASMAPSTLPGASSATVSASFDSVVGPGQTTTIPASGDQPTVTQTDDGGNTVLHMPDGTSIVVLGSTKIDTSFSH